MDKALKQRLVGASVLVILAVIVLPMLLSGRSDTLKQESRKIELPTKPGELSFETRRFPIETPNQSGTTAQTTTRPESEPPPAMPEDSPSGSMVDVSPGTGQSAQVKPAAEVVPDADPADVAGAVTADATEGGATGDRQTTPEIGDAAPPASPLAAPALSEPSDAPRYLVQVASFSNQGNANALAERLRQQDMSVAMDAVDRVGGRLHRVRIGPYTQRSEADSVVARLRSDMQDLSPRVVDLRPGDETTVSTPSDPLVRWVVQVGSFGDPANAESLVAKLRLAGMSAYSEKTTSGTGTAYKVRIGPEFDRDKASQLARRLKTEHGLEGLVMTTD